MRISSYLLKSRHGIYYFRMRRPAKISKGAADYGIKGSSKGEIRRSLKTRDRQKAIVLAQIVRWKIVNGEDLMVDDKAKQMQEMERSLEKEAEMYRVGETVFFRDAQGYNLDNPYEYQNLSEIMTDYEWKCLHFYLGEKFYYDNLKEENERQPIETPVAPKNPVAPVKKNRLLLLLVKFLKEKKRECDASTMKSYTLIAIRFMSIVANDPKKCKVYIEDISNESIRSYRDVLLNYPIRKKWKEGVTLDEFLSSGGENMASKTIKQHFSVVSNFLQWLEVSGYSIASNLSKILIAPKGKKGSKKRLPFSKAELQKIFLHSHYVEAKCKKSSDYWVPIIALYTGARQREICQLHITDIYKDEESSVFVIDINDQYEKKLKNDGSKRKIPVHKELIRLGLLEYVELMKKSSHKKLFPDEQPNSRGEFAAFSKRFNRLIDKMGIKKDDGCKRDFHSFRHTVGDALLDKLGVDGWVASTILGHAHPKDSMSKTVYSTNKNLKSIENLKKNIDKLSYGLDLKKHDPRFLMKRWGG